MPSEGLSLVVGSGLSVGVLAGVISGIFYVFINGIRNNSENGRKYGVTTKRQCCICGAHFSPRDDASDCEARKAVECASCRGFACKGACAELIASTGHWACKQCKPAHSWFKGILTALQSDSVTARMSKGEKDETGVVKRTRDVQDEEKETVRDFIERLVSAMLGADIDDTSVNRLYNDPQYDEIICRYHGDISRALTNLGSALHISVANLPVNGETPCTAHASLKNIIRRVLRDVSSMTFFKQPQDESQLQESNTNRTYEDLLATAILNKVIDNYQNDLRRSSSGSASSRKSGISRKSKKEYKHNKGQPEWKNTENLDYDDTASVSSIEEWCRSESSYGSKHIDQLSLTIHQKIEEISTSDDDNSNPQYVHTHNKLKSSYHSSDNEDNVKEDWQDNWLFSRKGKKSPNPVPVPMLVPSPITDYRALIGDRDAEDTTDLSETASDLDDTETASDIKTILVESRTVIGGKNLLDNINPELLHPETTEIKNNEENIIPDLKINVNHETDVHEKLENNFTEDDSFGSHSEKDAEYTEKYATFPRKIAKKSPMPSPRTSKCGMNENELNELINTQEDNMEEPEQIVDTEQMETQEMPVIIEGSYSQREKQKWQNPVAIQNNPYSKENLDKRLNGQTDHNSLFSRDFYIKEAAQATGTCSAIQDDNNEGSLSDLNIVKSKEVNEINAFDEKNFEITEDDVDEILKARPLSLTLSTDSDDVEVKRVFNVETGKVFKYKIEANTKEVIQNSKSPEGVKPFPKTKETIPKVDLKSLDENHNQTEEHREPIMKISTLNHLINNTQINNETLQKNPEENTLLENSIINDFSTPSISLLEISQDDFNIPQLTSCIDLRFINGKDDSENNNLLNGITKSTPNLHDSDERQYYSEDETARTTGIDPSELKHMPSVKNLKKIFDEELTGIKRTTSHLTTKPEFKARQKQIHSLTARSLSKEFRRELQKSTEIRDVLVEGTDFEENEKRANNENDLKKIPQTCRNKIAFFECLTNTP